MPDHALDPIRFADLTPEARVEERRLRAAERAEHRDRPDPARSDLDQSARQDDDPAPCDAPSRPGEGVGAAPVRNLHPVCTPARKAENAPKIDAP
jgi:hypothetical protein